MEDWKKKAENLKDKVVGEAKETYGKLTDDKATEVEGKVQSGVADVKENVANVKDNLTDAVEDAKDKNFFEDVKESLGTKKPVGEKFGDVVEDVKENAEELGDTIKDKVNDIKDRFKK